MSDGDSVPPADGSPTRLAASFGTATGPRTFDRVPPQSLEAEVSVLGAAMLSANAVSDTAQMLIPDYFYRNAHRLVFEAIVNLHRNGEAVDTVTVTDWLARRDRLDEVGGPAAIHDLTAAVPTSANAVHYARIVREKALLRRLIEAGTDVVRLGYEATDDAETVVDRAESLIYDVAQSGTDSQYAKLGDLLTESFEQIEKLAERGSEVTGLATGFNDLDRLTAGLQPQNLVIIAARPAMGKCLAGSTRIVDAATGQLWTIEQLVDQRPDIRVLTYDDKGVFVAVAPDDFVDNGVRPVYRVVTASGRTISATANHPFLTGDGWAELSTLMPGDEVAVAAALPVAGATAMRTDETYVLARLLRESTWTETVELPRHPTALDLAGDELPDSSVTFGHPSQGRLPLRRQPHRLVRRRDRVSRTASWMTHLGLLGLDSSEVCVPDRVFTAPRQQVEQFLDCLLGPDGSLASRSPRLLQDVQHLLLRCGVAAQVAWDANGGGTLTVTTGPTGSPAASIPVGASLAEHPHGADSVGAGGLAASAGPEHADQIAERGGSSVVWDRIVSIEPMGAERVFDLTVEPHHNFVANDFVVHNSSLALGISHYVSAKLKRPAILFSLEMSKMEIVNRLLSSEARIDSSRLRTGRLEDSDWHKLGNALGTLADAPLFIDDTPSISLNEIRAKCRRLQQKHGLDLVIVDYLQLMQSSRRIESRQQEVAEISRGMKMLAKELDVPVIALSQLSRQPESRTDKRPQLSDLRESGSIEQDADIVGFIYRDEVYDEDSPDRGIAELIISKHRNGATGVVRLAFLNHLTTFANLARGPVANDTTVSTQPHAAGPSVTPI
ncbi:MAG: replicative DNA helicase [Nitriliruptoraceae bacterium]